MKRPLIWVVYATVVCMTLKGDIIAVQIIVHQRGNCKHYLRKTKNAE